MSSPLKRYLSLMAGGAILCVGVSARADWNLQDPAKFIQLPDLVEGKDVEDMGPITLADDWMCTSVDPITDVHIWGSWLNNIKPIEMNGVMFRIGIWSDVPKAGTIPSHPGTELWHTITMPSAVRLWAPPPPVTEQFIHPTGTILGSDNEVWQYNFVDLKNEQGLTFVQQGTPENPVIYWLSVQLVNTPAGIFGWKTAATHNLDDAAFRLDDQAPWVDLRDPQNLANSLDLAFVITTPEPTSLALVALGGVALLVRRRRS
jgi:hypothetical protein